MPYRDGTGPQNQGSMTGRGLGPCNKDKSIFCREGFVRGAGFGRGFSFFRREKLDITDLKSYKKSLEEELDRINKEVEK